LDFIKIKILIFILIKTLHISLKKTYENAENDSFNNAIKTLKKVIMKINILALNNI
jgi:hypothetical protein